MLQRLWRPVPVLLAITAAVLATRLFFALHHAGLWGVDWGAYVLSALRQMGHPQIADFPRPPLAPGWLLVPFIKAFGTDTGVKLFSVAATIPLIPTWWYLSRQVLRPWPAVFATGLMLCDWKLAEMFTAGDLPMIGFTAMLWGILALWKMSQGTIERRWSIILALSIPGVAYTNQTSVGIAIPVLLAFGVAAGMQSKMGLLYLLRRSLAPVLIGLTVCLPLLPIYLVVAPGSGLLRYPGPVLALYRWPNFAWIQFAAGLPVCAFVLWKARGFTQALAVVFLVLTLLTPLYSFDESLINIFYRSSYLQSAMLMLLLTWMFSTYLSPSTIARPLAWAWASFAVFAIVGGWLYQMQASSKLDRMITTNSQAAVAYVMEQPDVDAIITNSYSMALAVAAMTEHPVAWSQVYDPPPAYAKQHDDVVCVFGWIEGCNAMQAAEDLDASYIIVDTIWPTYNRDVVDRLEGAGPVYKWVDRVANRPMDNGCIWEAPEPDPVQGTCTRGPSQELGYIWGEPAGDPWAYTDVHAPWLEAVWEQGSTRVWRVNRDYFTLQKISDLPSMPTQMQFHEGHTYVTLRDGQVLRDGVAWLDLRPYVWSDPDSPELGLQSIAFGPNHGIYAAYTMKQPDGVVVSWVDPDPMPLLFVPRFPKPDDRAAFDGAPLIEYTKHNGGGLAFGPDGWLYVGFGNGRGNLDDGRVTWGLAQDPTTYLGKVVRINVDTGAVELVASGFRNPWRLAFTPGGTLLVTDVGEGTWEEVNVVVPDGNYGWPAMEGSMCYQQARETIGDPRPVVAPPCEPSKYTGPLYEYRHDGKTCAIIGGVVIEGEYLFGDYCSGQVWALDPGTGAVRTVFAGGQLLETVGIAYNDGTLYLLGRRSGEGYGVFTVAGSDLITP